jgi:hypothetical protein
MRASRFVVCACARCLTRTLPNPPLSPLKPFQTMATLSPLSPSPLAAFAVPIHEGGTVDVVPRWRGRALAVHPPVRDGAAPVSRGVWAITHPVSGLRAGTFRGTLRDAVKLARVWDRAFWDAVVRPFEPDLNQWEQRFAWMRQCDGTSHVVGPVSSDHPDHASRIGCTDHNETPDNAVILPDVPRKRATAADGDGGEQFPATLTIWATTPGRARFARVVCGRDRLRNPETGKPVRMTGDVAAFRNPANPLTPVLKLWFRGVWHVVPTIAECMEWSLDGVCETPDGRMVEPDAPDAWLSLLGVV